MAEYFQDPFNRAFIVPFFGSLVLTLLIRFLGRAEMGRHYGAAAVGAIFIWVCGMVLGIPEFPPRADSSAIAYIVLLGWLIGLGLDTFDHTSHRSAAFELIALVLFGAAVIWWLNGAPSQFAGFGMGLAGGAIALVFWLMTVVRIRWVAQDPRIATIMMIMIAAGLGLIGMLAVLPSDRDLAFGLAAALAGYLTVNLPTGRVPFSSAVLLASGVAVLVIGTRLSQTNDISGVALTLIVLVVFADTVSRRIEVGPLFLRTAVKLAALVGLSLIPLALAAAATLVEIRLNS